MYFFLLAREFDGLHSLSLLVEFKFDQSENFSTDETVYKLLNWGFLQNGAFYSLEQ